MPEALLVRAIWLSLGVCALLAAFQYAVYPLMVDVFRQFVFEHRAKLFRMMAEGRIDREETAYTSLRTVMNGLLRLAEHLTFSRMVFLGVHERIAGGEIRKPRTAEVIDAVDDETLRGELKTLYITLLGGIVLFVVVSSPLGLACTTIGLLWTALHALVQKRSVRKAVSEQHTRLTEPIEVEAYSEAQRSYRAMQAA